MAEYGSATWKLSLWLSNEYDVYHTMRCMMAAGLSAEDAFYELYVEPVADFFASKILMDLLCLVDWYEIESDLKGDDWGDESDV